jgi:VanZ family protein
MDQQVSASGRFLYWVPAILIAAAISLFSTHYFSGEETGKIIIPVLHWLFPGASLHLLRLMHAGIRKAAHITEFGLFSITVFRGIRGGRFGWRFSWALATLAIAVAYAGLDEWHQSFVPLREARIRDVGIDAFGAVLAQVLVWFYATLRTNRVGSRSFQETLRANE